jgi:hypothetical protein
MNKQMKPLTVCIVVFLSLLGLPVQSNAQGYLQSLENTAAGLMSSPEPPWSPTSPLQVQGRQQLGQVVTNYFQPPQMPQPVVSQGSLMNPKGGNLGDRGIAPWDDRDGVVKTEKVGSSSAKTVTPNPKKVSGGSVNQVSQNNPALGLGGTVALTPFQERFLTNQEAGLKLQADALQVQTSSLGVQTAQLGVQRGQLNEAKTLNSLTEANVYINAAGASAAWINTILNRIPFTALFSKANSAIGGMFSRRNGASSQDGFPALPAQ